MNCSNCQAANPDKAKFCRECGKPLATLCPNCGRQNSPDAKFCNNCGFRLGAPAQKPVAAAAAPEPSLPPDTGLSSAASRFIPNELAAKLQAARASRAMVGERRIVSMLFCDVKGSTAAAEQLDPEEWTDIMNGAFERMIQPIYHYEGTVARLMGDAILAFFGAPIAHEDDPERAVRAGLEIVEGIQPYRAVVKNTWGIEFDVRVGINTGLVVVGPVGSDLRMEYTALGDAINLAARMEQTAAPGTVRIAEATHKLLAPLFDFEDLGGIEVKGKAEPVPAYRPLRPKLKRGALRGLEGLNSPLVGREAEMAAVAGALIETQRGRGQIISIMGEAGLGKSRLMAELRLQSLPEGGQTQAVHWLEGRCLSYQTNTPYAPFVELFAGHFGLRDAPAAGDAYPRLAEQVAAVSGEKALEIAPFLATLLGLPLSAEPYSRVRYLEPPQLRRRLHEAIQAYLGHLSRGLPVILTIDDLHWIDPTSLDLLQSLLPLTDRAPLMLVAIFRPHGQDPSWQFHEAASRNFGHRYQALSLRPLEEGQARRLVANLLHIEDLPDKVRQLILDKAEGNPFFVEEVIRSLLDSGLVISQDGHWRATREIENIAVPDNLAAVINARLDRLDDETRSLVQSASVIGRQFSLALLQAVHPAALDLERPLLDLLRRELLREKTRIPERVYTFKHALTQETAYNSLLLKTRRDLHLSVAGALERMAPDQVNDLAYHFLAARQPARALPFLIAAAGRAATAYATQEAIGFYRQSLEILQSAGDLPRLRHVYEGLGNALIFANRPMEAVETFQAMLAAADEAGDVQMQVSALNKLSSTLALRMGQFEQAEQYLFEADRRARRAQDKPGLSEMGLIRCMMCTAVADFPGVVRYMDETLALGEELGVQEQVALGLTHIAASQAFMLQFDKALENYEKGIRLCREIGDRQHEAELMAQAGPICYLARGDIATAQQLAAGALTIATEIGDLNALINSCRMLGYMAEQQGEYERAIAYFQRYLDGARASQFNWSEAEALCLIGATYLDISTALLERVIGFHGQALQILEQPNGAMMGATAWAEIGFCLDAAGQFEKAAEYFQRALNTPTVTINLERPRLLVGAALVGLKLGQLSQAAQAAAEARSFAEANGMVFFYPLVALAESSIAEAQADTDGALAALERAEQLAAGMGMLPIVWQAQARQAQALLKLGRPAEAQARRVAAQAVIASLAEFFQDKELREHFVAYAGQKMAAFDQSNVG